MKLYFKYSLCKKGNYILNIVYVKKRILNFKHILYEKKIESKK